MPAIKGLEWTFDTASELYAKMRPDYVDALYKDIFDYVPIDEASTAVEIGIGGGQATLPILQTGCKVTAVEYGAHLAELCREKFRDYPNFSCVTEKFEDFVCDAGACDLVYSASAFHWIPEEIGYTKVSEMLKSGGVFARFANHPYADKGRPELVKVIQKLYAVYMPNSASPKEYTAEDAERRANIAAKYGFADSCYKLYHRTRSFTAKEYVSLLGTYSDHIAMEDGVREEFFAKIEQTIDAFDGQITIYDTIDLQLARKP